MKSAQVKRILTGAAKLPPGKARRVVAALAAKEDSGNPSAEDLLDQAADAMQAAMEMVMLPIILNVERPTSNIEL